MWFCRYKSTNRKFEIHCQFCIIYLQLKLYEIKTGEWVDVFTYRVFDGELESNIANVKVNIKSKEPESKTAKDENFNDSNSPKITLEGPNSASPGENVTLLASLTGIDRNQITQVNIKQIKGQSVLYSECTINDLTCTYPSISIYNAKLLGG